MTPNPQQDFVPKTIKSRDVHFVRFYASGSPTSWAT